MLRRTVLALPLAALVSAAACQTPGDHDELRLMVPNAPGSGYDITARTVATTLDVSAVRRGVEVFNLPGAGGMVGLRRLVYESGNGSLMMLMGLGLVGAQHTTPISATLADVTPIARLIEEPEVVVVTRDSSLRSLEDLVGAWREHPTDMTVGGGSSTGGPDHLAAMLMAKAAGIAPTSVRYQRFDGGGVLLAAVLSKRVVFAVSSLGEIAGQVDSGELRVLAVTSADRAERLDAPTLREAGLDVVFANWRGLVAPPGLAEPDRLDLVSMVASLRESASWRQAIADHRWTDSYIPSAEFGRFVREQDARVTQILAELGLDS